MQQKELIIRITNQEISFSPDYSISIESTTIPYQHLKFKTHIPVFWRVEMLRYQSEEKCLVVKITSYNPEGIDKFQTQKIKDGKKIERLIFEDKYDWHQLSQQLSSYTQSKFIDQLYNHVPLGGSGPMTKGKSAFENRGYLNVENHPNAFAPVTISELPGTWRKTYIFYVKFEEATFENGRIIFKKKVKELGLDIDFHIDNSCLLPEFNNIKTWFCRKLKCQRFFVTAEVSFSGNQIVATTAHSEQIDLITKELIEKIRHASTINLLKTPAKINESQMLFTTEDIFKQHGTDVTSNIFGLSDDDILSTIVNQKHIRNAKEITYLASQKQAITSPIRYTLQPMFGFLFTVVGKTQEHFVWELLNSNATYIWSVEKKLQDTDDLLAIIERELEEIQKYKRNKYRQLHLRKGNDYLFHFEVVHHKLSNEGISKWENKIVQILSL